MSIISTQYFVCSVSHAYIIALQYEQISGMEHVLYNHLKIILFILPYYIYLPVSPWAEGVTDDIPLKGICMSASLWGDGRIK